MKKESGQAYIYNCLIKCLTSKDIRSGLKITTNIKYNKVF